MKPIILLTTFCLGLSSAALAQSDNTLAITGARIIDGTGAAPIEDGVLLVEDNRIAAVGSRQDVDIPDTAERLDAQGLTIMPGIVNAHGHAAEGTADKLATYAHYGITTVLSLGGEDASAVALRDQQAENGPNGNARLLLAGPIIPSLDSPAEATEAVQALADMNVDWVKTRVEGGSTDEAVYAEMIAESHRQGLPIAIHMYNLEDTQRIVEHGADMLAHSVRDAEMDAELLAQMRDKSICLSPTLMREVSTYIYADTPDFFSDPFFLQEANPEDIENLQQPDAQQRAAANAEQGRSDLAMAQRNLKLAHDAGVKIAMGTDSGAFPSRFPGYFEHMELELMVEAGMSPAEVLHSATGVAASCIGVDDELGTLSPGKLADFLILEENPLEDIRNTRTIQSIWINGERL